MNRRVVTDSSELHKAVHNLACFASQVSIFKKEKDKKTVYISQTSPEECIPLQGVY